MNGDDGRDDVFGERFWAAEFRDLNGKGSVSSRQGRAEKGLFWASPLPWEMNPR